MARAVLLLLCALGAFAAVPASDAPEPEREAWRPLPFFYDLYTFRGAGGRTSVVAAYAVPVDELERERAGGDVRYRFDVTLVLADTARRAVSRTDDSVFVRVPYPLPGSHLLHTHIEVEAPPSGKTVHRVIMTDATTPGVGQLYEAPFPIPDYAGDTLMLSDVALGRPGARNGWSRGGVTLSLLPTSQFPQGSFEVYYEVYNLASGTPYSTQLVLEPLDGEGRPDPGHQAAVRTRFAGRAGSIRGGALSELRRVDAQLEKGGYRLTVTVRDEVTGRTARRHRDFQVRGGSGGATMVHALPRGSLVTGHR